MDLSLCVYFPSVDFTSISFITADFLINGLRKKKEKNMRIDIDSKNLELAQNPNVSHDSAEDMYDCYGAHISTEHDGDVCIQSVDYDWLDDDQDAEALLAECHPDMTADECETLVALARRIREAMDGIEDALERAYMSTVYEVIG